MSDPLRIRQMAGALLVATPDSRPGPATLTRQLVLEIAMGWGAPILPPAPGKVAERVPDPDQPADLVSLPAVLAVLDDQELLLANSTDQRLVRAGLELQRAYRAALRAQLVALAMPLDGNG